MKKEECFRARDFAAVQPAGGRRWGGRFRLPGAASVNVADVVEQQLDLGLLRRVERQQGQARGSAIKAFQIHGVLQPLNAVLRRYARGLDDLLLGYTRSFDIARAVEV